MTTNKFAQTKETPIRLEIDRGIYGHYQFLSTAQDIGRALIDSNKAKYYRIYEGDNLVDESN